LFASFGVVDDALVEFRGLRAHLRDVVLEARTSDDVHVDLVRSPRDLVLTDLKIGDQIHPQIEVEEAHQQDSPQIVGRGKRLNFSIRSLRVIS